DLLGTFVAPLKDTKSWTANVAATALAVGGWGWFLYQGVTDPLGGINTLWPLFGISNQMLATIALTMATVVLFRMKRERYAWVTLLPLSWLLICTLTAGWQKMFHSDPKIGFLAHAAKYSDAFARGEILAPAKSAGQMRQVIFNDYVNTGLCALFITVVVAMLFYGVKAIAAARASDVPTTREVADAVA
nr:carbon starvation protein A [Pseudomonadota bacterium]